MKEEKAATSVAANIDKIGMHIEMEISMILKSVMLLLMRRVYWLTQNHPLLSKRV